MVQLVQVFGPYVQQWIDSSQDALCHRCKVLEANTFAAAVNPDMMQEEGAHVCHRSVISVACPACMLTWVPAHSIIKITLHI